MESDTVINTGQVKNCPDLITLTLKPIERESKMTKTKAIWDYHATEFEELVMVKAMAAVKARMSFLNVPIKITGQKKKDMMESFAMSNRNQPGHFTVIVPYKEDEIEAVKEHISHETEKGIKITVDWHHDWERFNVALKSPATNTYYPNGTWSDRVGRLSPKPTGSKFYEGMLEKLEDAIDEGKASIDKDIKEAIGKDKLERARNNRKEKLEDELGVDIKKGESYNDEYVYGKGRSYSMTFQRRKEKDLDGEVLFSIEKIKGRFTKDEIKQLLQLVGGNKRAIAARLTEKPEREDD
jgi:hypothetical protein